MRIDRGRGSYGCMERKAHASCHLNAIQRHVGPSHKNKANRSMHHSKADLVGQKAIHMASKPRLLAPSLPNMGRLHQSGRKTKRGAWQLPKEIVSARALKAKAFLPTFPTTLQTIKVINAHIGGSTGAKLVEDVSNMHINENKYVQKTTDTIQPAHLIAEFFTNKAYKALGVKVPEVMLYNAADSRKIDVGNEYVSGEKLAMLSKFIPGTTVELGAYLSQEGEIQAQEIQKNIQKHFVADCLLANWDVIGLAYDNIRVDLHTKEIWRVDNGSGLEYRAQGAKKGAAFGAVVTELDSMRSSINMQAQTIFGTISNQEIARQIDEIMPKKKAFLAAIPVHLKHIMEQRFDYLKVYKIKHCH